MIYSIANANVDEATHHNVLGAWSDLVAGQRPEGLLDCHLLRADDSVQIVAVWETLDHHDRAVHDDGSHPGYLVFEAAGLDCTHTVYTVLGTIHQH